MWAWACTVIHMATGAAPFANLSPNQIVITVGVHKKSPDIPTSLPPALQTLLASCLSVDPAARPRALQALQVLRSLTVPGHIPSAPSAGPAATSSPQQQACSPTTRAPAGPGAAASASAASGGANSGVPAATRQQAQQAAAAAAATAAAASSRPAGPSGALLNQGSSSSSRRHSLRPSTAISSMPATVSTPTNPSAPTPLTLEGHRGGVSCCAISPHDGSMLVSGSDYATLKVWDLNTGRCVRTLEGHTRVVYCCAFSPHDGHTLVSGSRDSTLKVWRRSS